MTDATSPSTLLRQHKPGEHQRVTFVELFFDLVFVFAITQLSHSLLQHYTPIGLAETAFLTFAVWWVWIYTSWATNWLDPQSTPVRLLLFAMMAAGLVLSSSIPEAFGEKGLAFAGAYVAMQLVRTTVLALALRGHSPANYRNFQRILIWLSTSAVFWIVGGFLEYEQRWMAWGIALTLEAIGPALMFWAPGMGRSQTTDWNVSPEHFAERCALFVIIALGESLLVTGGVFAGQAWTPISLAAFGVCLAGTLAMWWVYFSIAAEDASEEFTRSDDTGRLARSAYTYCHIPLVAGIILSAVSDEFVLAHPDHHVEPFQAVAILGGPALFLLGNLAFKRIVFEEFPRSHIVGLLLLGLLAALVPFATTLVLAAAAAGVLLVTGIWENIATARWHKKHPEWRAAGKDKH
ncbi:MAG: low temperature requirement protein A [Hyphomonadaceae bacterium]|nr:low temperature requirement protein A [Hyphomonadaceae bacterium]